MNFRNRLTLFFLIIVVLPMIGTAVVLLKTSSQIEGRSADALLYQSLSSVNNLYQDWQQQNLAKTSRLSTNKYLRKKWQQNPAELKKLFTYIIEQKIIQTADFYSADDELLWSKRPDKEGLYKTKFDYNQSNQIDYIIVSAIKPSDFLAEVKKITGHEASLQTSNYILKTNPDLDLSDYAIGKSTLFPGTQISIYIPKQPHSPLSSEPFLAVLFIILLLIAFTLAYFLRKSMETEVKDLVRVARRIGSGDFAARASSKGKDEMGQLAHELNNMSYLLKKRENDLRQQRRELEHSIHYLGQAVASGLDRKASLKILLKGIIDSCHAEKVRLIMYEPHKELLEENSEMEIEANNNDLHKTMIKLEEHRYQAEEIFKTESGIWRGLATTVNDQDKIIGIISLARRGRPFNSAEIELLNYLTAQTVVSLENIALHDLISEQALTDELTQLNNRRNFDNLLTKECKRANRFDHPMSLLMIDIDDFKAINDQHGHLAGDKILQEIGNLLKELSRTVDECARYGGEEFAVIMPETDEQEAYNLGERLRETVAAKEIQYKRATINLTISVGVATLVGDEEELLASADQALYQAKKTGKNKVIQKKAAE